ncbi:MAG: resuscitation-promoting factor RpfA [Solirubrobacterales bacterium]|nr:resuscitation-promoting factor RpfA [Solirubrobacterales bacterium]
MFVLACGVALVIPIARAGAETIEGLEGKIGDARDEAETLNDQIEGDIVALAEARNEADRAAGEESELSQVLAEGQERSAALARKLDAAEAELATTQERLERAQAVLAQRLVEIYKSSGMNEIDVLLDSEGFEDLATRAELLGRIQDADRGLAERVRALKADVQDQVLKVSRAKKRSDKLNAEVEAARDEIAAARAAAEARAAQLQDARAAQAASVEQLESQMSGWAKDVEKLEDVSADEAVEEVGNWNNFGPWAIPEAIVMCESGGNFQALNPSSGAGGAYQILPSTWAAYGGKGLPHEAPPAEQHRIAALIWADSGPSAWVCAG